MWSQVSAYKEDEGDRGGSTPAWKQSGTLLENQNWTMKKETNQGVRGSGLIWP